MRKIVLSITAISCFVFLGTSQITITATGSSADISGGVHVINVDANHPDIVNTGEIVLDLAVHNNTGTSKSWRITRVHANVPTAWSDLICLTSCFPPSSMVEYCTPASQPLVVADGAEGEILLHFSPEQTAAGSATYRYYLGDCTTFDDSVDVQINFTLGTKAMKSASNFTIVPNPASDFVQITTNSSEAASLKIVDILGNIVFTEVIVATKKIDVSHYKNGVYFVSIENPNSKIVSRKLVIKN
jgi:hypothetical protein